MPRLFPGLLVGGLLVLACLRLAPGYRVLLLEPPARRSAGPFIAVGRGAVDLVSRRLETQDFFGGSLAGNRVYPPATYAILWPFVASSTVPVARWTWAVVLTASLAWLCRTCARASGFADPLARIAMGLLPLGLLATSAALRTGQLTIPVVALTVAAVLRLSRSPRSRRDDVSTAALFTLASLKPTLIAPMGWMLLFVPRSIVPAALTTGLYGAVTAIALFVRSRAGGVPGARPGRAHPAHYVEHVMFAEGYANLQNWLLDVGIGMPWLFLPSIVGLAALGAWTWRHRGDDPWILLAVASLVARLCFYHRIYDDLLLLPALVALARLASGATVTSETSVGSRPGANVDVPRLALWTLFAAAGVMAMPATLPAAWRVAACGPAWVAALVVLLAAATRSPTSRGPDAGVGVPSPGPA